MTDGGSMWVVVRGYRNSNDRLAEEVRDAEVPDKASAVDLARLYLIGWHHCEKVRVRDAVTDRILAEVKR